MRILTVTLNPALDINYVAPDFQVGNLNRPVSKSVSAGGKGINVARAFRSLGGNAVATGFIGGLNGNILAGIVSSEGIDTQFIHVQCDTRVCSKIADPINGSQTELNENGPDITDTEYQAFLDAFRNSLTGIDLVVLSGSIPPGIHNNVYAELIDISRCSGGVDVVLDTSGLPLKEGIHAKPFLVKPNIDEAKELGISSADWRDTASILREQYAVSLALVTAGSKGAVISSNNAVWEAVPPKIDVHSVVGSGDSLTAGFIWAYFQYGDIGRALQYGVACGAVNAMSYRPGDIDHARVTEMASRVILNKLI